MIRFGIFISIILQFENGSTVCGYVNDPADRGGETVSGITRRSHPELSIWRSLDALSLGQKKIYRPSPLEWAEIYNIYRNAYYDPLNIDAINSPNLALNVFDVGVNSGIKKAASMLQQVVGVRMDGRIGPGTLAAANNGTDWYPAFKQARIEWYRQLAARGSNYKFLNGWLKRVSECHI